ncbi:hypothetical protein GF369_04070 [Candidatus Peregrinibacteria bacterium]|nr:hypothetical protein [Candidatus Peregrinibacteria bacterium]
MLDLLKKQFTIRLLSPNITMNYKERIFEAWQFTQNNKKLIRWYGFIPALLSTIVGIGYVTYQILAFKSSPLFDDAPQSFAYVVVTTILNFIRDNIELTLPLIITGIVLAILYFLLPVLLDAAMIQVITRKRHGQKITLPEGLKFGMLRFLPYLEYTLLMGTFSFIAISAEAAFILRNLGPEVFKTLLPIIGIILVVTFILHILFTFAEYYIVIDETGVMNGIVKSCTLVILNLQQTFMLVILMLIIAVRILMQIVLVILIPALIVVGLAYYASVSLPEYGLIILGILSGIFLLFASYLAAVVHVFSVAVWTYTFLDFTSAKVITAREIHS